MEADFGGYATRANMVCSDGLTISGGAFKHNNKLKVPLVWQHQTNSPENILGYSILEHREDGMYSRNYFNDTPSAQMAKAAVEHGDIEALSINANNLKKKGNQVLHGNIREVSLVLAGANPGAYIDYVNLQHGDSDEADGEAIIYNDLTLEHADSAENEGDTVATDTATNADKTVKDVFDEFTEEQKNVVYFMIGEAIDASEDGDTDESVSQSDYYNPDEALKHYQEGFDMARNVFEQNGSAAQEGSTLTHAQLETIVSDAQRFGSLKDSFLQHAGTFGIDNIDILFPDAQTITNTPEFKARRTEWVAGVLNGAKHSPFSRIKTIVADITAEEARARGYVKGNLKKDEIVTLLKRVTTPTTVYKKQKLDRDDIVDITDLDVVAWLKAEMRLMLDEEIARAVLLGDGRSSSDEDKIKDPAGATEGAGIRSIANDDDFYAHQVQLAAGLSAEAVIEALIRSRSAYKGSGTPTFYTTDDIIADLILLKDKMGRRLYETEAALAAVLRVDRIVPVEVMTAYPNILGILVNIGDYTLGADKGGEISFFDDFDIDYNQQKYLIETRLSGALTKPKSAVVVKRTIGSPATPTSPSFNGETNTITIPTTTGIIYQIDGEPVTGPQVITETTEVTAVAAENYYIPSNVSTTWTFVYTGE